MSANAMSSVWGSAIRAVQSQPKKAGGLAALGIVMGLLWLRALSGGPNGPAPASAGIVHGAAVINSHRADNRAHPNSGLAALHQFLHEPLAPLTLSRDLFSINLDQFPTDGTRASVPIVGDGFWESLAKSMRSRAEEKDKRRKLVEQVSLEAAQLHVQSTIMGSTPRALIDGNLVGVNDMVGGGKGVAPFRVVRITARGIVVERDGIKLEVRFK